MSLPLQKAILYLFLVIRLQSKPESTERQMVNDVIIYMLKNLRDLDQHECLNLLMDIRNQVHGHTRQCGIVRRRFLESLSELHHGLVDEESAYILG